MIFTVIYSNQPTNIRNTKILSEKFNMKVLSKLQNKIKHIFYFVRKEFILQSFKNDIPENEINRFCH